MESVLSDGELVACPSAKPPLVHLASELVLTERASGERRQTHPLGDDAPARIYAQAAISLEGGVAPLWACLRHTSQATFVPAANRHKWPLFAANSKRTGSSSTLVRSHPQLDQPTLCSNQLSERPGPLSWFASSGSGLGAQMTNVFVCHFAYVFVFVRVEHQA